MRREGIDISGYRSKRVGKELVDNADLVLAMEKSHKDMLVSLLPQNAHKVFTLKEFAGETEDIDVSDPYGYGLKTYEACAKEIKNTLAKAFDKIICYLHEGEPRSF
jgi:protein-tyrosine-phosphatase